MNIRTTLIASSLIAASLVSGTAHAILEGRDLDGSAGSFEAYYDTVLDITWLTDANYGAGSSYDNGSSTTDGRMTWANANAWAADLSIVDNVNNITYDNWRLPTLSPINGVSFNYTVSTNGSTDVSLNITSTASEMSYMYYVNLGNLGDVSPNGCNVDYSSNQCLDNVGPFSNLQSWIYWSALEYAPNTSQAWDFHTAWGYQDQHDKDEYFNAWAVSTGDVAAVPEADTWAMLLAGLWLVGAVAQRRKQVKA